MPQDFLPYKDKRQDARRKILPEQHREIRAYYSDGHSYQQTADHYNISKRLAIFIVRPETLKTLQERNRRNEHWKTYYDKEAHRKAMHKYREKKRKLKLQAPRKKKPIA